MSIMQYWCSVLFFEFLPSVVVSCMWDLQLLRAVWVYAQTYIHKLNCKYFFAIVLFYQFSPWKSYSETVSWEGLSGVAPVQEGKKSKPKWIEGGVWVFWRGFSHVCKEKYFMYLTFKASLLYSALPSLLSICWSNDIFNSCFFKCSLYFRILFEYFTRFYHSDEITFILILNFLITFNFHFCLFLYLYYQDGSSYCLFNSHI